VYILYIISPVIEELKVKDHIKVLILEYFEFNVEFFCFVYFHHDNLINNS